MLTPKDAVFLYGGHGGPGAGPGRGQQIMENKDCIFVNLPLFKKKIDPPGPFKDLLINMREILREAMR